MCSLTYVELGRGDRTPNFRPKRSLQKREKEVKKEQKVRKVSQIWLKVDFLNRFLPLFIPEKLLSVQKRRLPWSNKRSPANRSSRPRVMFVNPVRVMLVNPVKFLVFGVSVYLNSNLVDRKLQDINYIKDRWSNLYRVTFTK